MESESEDALEIRSSMDTLTFISKIFESIGWPISAIVICFVLKSPIENLLRRVSELRNKDTVLNFNPEIQGVSTGIEGNLSIADKVPPDQFGLIKEQEKKIYDSLRELEIQSDSEKVKVLAKHYANLQIRSGYEEINRRIYGSQLDLLQALNAQSSVEDQFLKSFYERAKQQYSDDYENYSFEAYLNFLLSTGMVNIKDGNYFITVLGRGFLAFLVESGISTKRLY